MCVIIHYQLLLLDSEISERHTDEHAYKTLNAIGRVVLRATSAYHFEPIDMTSNHGPHITPASNNQYDFQETTDNIALRTKNTTNMQMQPSVPSTYSHSGTAWAKTNISQESSFDISRITSGTHNIITLVKAHRHKKRAQRVAYISLTGEME